MAKFSASQTVADHMRKTILSGDILPGGRLIQEQIAEALGVSRIPVREGLRLLEAEGLVVYEKNSGYSVARMDAAQLHSTQRIRQLLEAEAVRQAASAGRLGPALAGAMKQQHLKLQQLPVDETVAVATKTRAFHFTLFEACCEPVLLRILRNLWDNTDSWRTIYYRLIFASDAEHRAAVFAEHRHLIELVENGQPEAVIELLDSLRSNGIAAVESAVVRSRGQENRVQAHLMMRALQM